MRIIRFYASNFRCLRSLDLQFEPLAVLIGPNGAGKTTVLDALDLWCQGFRGNLRPAINALQGLPAILTQASGNPAPELALGLEMELGELSRRVTLELGLSSRGGGYTIDQESLLPSAQRGQPWLHRTPNNLTQTSELGSRFDPVDTYDLGQTELLLGSKARTGTLHDQVQRPFRTSLFSRGVNLELVKQPKAPDPLVADPAPDGRDLVPYLYNLRENHPASFEDVMDALRVAFPGFLGLDFPSSALGQVILRWREEGGREFQAHQLSDGTLRFLYLAALLLGTPRPDLIMLDEPECYLHPSLILHLAEMLKGASNLGSQVIVATHSDRLVRWLEPRNLVIFDKEDGLVTALRGDAPSLNLEAWLQDFSLDEVWLKGGLGGRP